MAVAAAVVAFSAIAGAQQKRKARRAQARASRLDQRRAELTAARESKKRLSESRKQRAQLEAEGISAGIGSGSSPVQGAIGSVGTSTAETIGFSQQNLGFARGIGDAGTVANRAIGRAQTFQAIGNVAGSFAGA